MINLIFMIYFWVSWKRVYIFQKVFLPEESTNGVEDISNEEEIKAQETDAATEVPPVENEPESCDKPKYKSEFERQLDEIRKQMEAIQQLPSVLLANLSVLQVQLDKIVEAKAANDQNQVDYSFYLFLFIIVTLHFILSIVKKTDGEWICTIK